MEGGRCDVAFATGLLRPGWAGCDAALAAGLAQPAIVRARGVLACETGRKSTGEAAGVWWRDVLGEMIRGLGGYCSGGASREASSCGGKGLCLFASVRSVIEYTALKVRAARGPEDSRLRPAEVELGWKLNMITCGIY